MIWKALREESEGIYCAYLAESSDGEELVESVWIEDGALHVARFPSSRLGDADRQTYIQTVLASVIRKHQIGA